MSGAIQQQIDNGAVPSHVSNVCPKGTKMWVLEVGWLEADEAFMIRGANISTKSKENEAFVNKRRALPVRILLGKPFLKSETYADTFAHQDVLHPNRAPA